MTLKWVPEGINKPFQPTITETPLILNAFPYKWFQVTINNDDKNNTIYCTINRQPRITPTILEAGERIEHDYSKPTIWQVVLWTDPGKTAKARIDTMR